MKIHLTLAFSSLCLLSALPSCTGDEKPAAASGSTASRGAASESRDPAPAQPASPDASSATRQPAATEPAALQLDPAPMEPPQPTQPPAATPPATAEEEEPLLGPEDAAIPTQEEADLEAAQSIHEENADAELQKLEQELGAEGGG